VTVVICTNVISNLLLNLCIAIVFYGRPGNMIYLLELLVMIGEYSIYEKAFGRSRKLALLTFAANCLSYGIGLLIF